MKSQWFYIRRFKARRQNWHIARRHKKTGAIYLIEAEPGEKYTSNYYEAYQLLTSITALNNNLYEYKIINESDLEYIEKIFKKVNYDVFK